MVGPHGPLSPFLWRSVSPPVLRTVLVSLQTVWGLHPQWEGHPSRLDSRSRPLRVAFWANTEPLTTGPPACSSCKNGFAASAVLCGVRAGPGKQCRRL